MTKYWQKFNDCNNREKLLIIIALSVGVYFIIYSLFYLSFINYIQAKENQLQEKQQILAWMKTINLSTTEKKKESINAEKLLAVITRDLKVETFNKFAYNLQQLGDSEIQLSFKKVPFNYLLSWLWHLNQTYSLVIAKMNIHKTDREGLVKITINIHT